MLRAFLGLRSHTREIHSGRVFGVRAPKAEEADAGRVWRNSMCELTRLLLLVFQEFFQIGREVDMK